jgi:hypothetical protein
MKKLAFTVVVATLFTLSTSMGKPAFADVEADVAAHMEQRRNDKYNVPDFTPEMKANLGLVIAALWKYVGDPSENVRVELIGRAAAMASNNTVQLSVRREAVELVLAALESEPFPALVSNTIDNKLMSLPPSSFSRRAGESIQRMVKRGDESPSVIRLVGVANVEALRPQLQEWAVGPFAFESALYTHSRSWSARWALAAMGDEDALKRLIMHLEAAPNVSESANLLKWLAYTRQMKAVETLVRYLYSEESFPSLSEALSSAAQPQVNRLGTPLSAYALHHLSQITDDFVDDLGESAFLNPAEKVKRAQERIATHGLINVKINR